MCHLQLKNPTNLLNLQTLRVKSWIWNQLSFIKETLQESQIQSEFSSDIGFYVGVQNLDDETKAKLLQKPWTPPANYQFPHNEVFKSGKLTKKYAQRTHLQKFHWLAFSHKDKGLYCKYCVLFSKSSGGGYQTNTPLKRLMKEPSTFTSRINTMPVQYRIGKNFFWHLTILL